MTNAADGDIVQFDNVGLRYGTDREVLTDLSFTLYPGSFYFLTGASGAGKTSLLKLLYLSQRPSRGMIRLFGTDAITMPRESLPAMRRRLGVVFQDFRLVQHLSAFDNVALPLRVAGAAERDIEKPVRDMLDWVGLTDRMEARPATLSGGEQQRVAIARAVIGRPEILIADEPTGNVDPEMAIKLLRLFEALNRLGTTVLVATHDVHLLKKVPEFADHAARPRPAGRSDRRFALSAAAPVDAGEGAGMNGQARRSPRTAESQLLPLTRFSGPMPWVIAIMVALTVIAAAAGLALHNTAKSASAELSGGVTIQIVEPEPGMRAKQAQSARDALRSMQGIKSVRLVPQEEVDALIEPWLGAAASGEEAIPVPALIDARLDGPVTPRRLEQLRAAMRVPAPSARVDAQSSWLKPVFDAIGSLQWLAAALVALLALAMAAAVLLATRTALGTHRETIEIVHLLGGTDAQIARLFQRTLGFDAAGGGAVGLAAGLVVVLFLGKRFALLGAGLIDAGALAWADWSLLALVPVAGVALAMLTARLSVTRALRNML